MCSVWEKQISWELVRDGASVTFTSIRWDSQKEIIVISTEKMQGKCTDSIIIMVNQEVHWASFLRSLIPLYSTRLSCCSLHSSLTFSLVPEVAAVWSVLSQKYLWCILEANRSTEAARGGLGVGKPRGTWIYLITTEFIYFGFKKWDWVHRPFPCNLNQDFFLPKKIQFFLLSLKKCVILGKRKLAGWR